MIHNTKSFSISAASEEYRKHAVTVKDMYFRINEILANYPNLLADFDCDELLQQVIRAQERIDRGKQDPLTGIPFIVDDLFNSEKMTTKRGSPYYEGYTAGNNARSIFNLLSAGAVLIGKTYTSELGRFSQNITYTDERSSTFGAAVPIKQGVAMFSLNMHGGALIQTVSSSCEVYGFKPSFGRIPRTGVLSMRNTIDCPAIYTNFLSDIKTIINAIMVKGSNYPFSFGKESYAQSMDKTWNVGIIGDGVAFTDTIKNEKCIKFNSISIPDIFKSWIDEYEVICRKAASIYCETNFMDRQTSGIEEIIHEGSGISATQYTNALEHQVKLIDAVDEWLREYDILISFGDKHFGSFCSYTHIPAVFIPDGNGTQIASRKYCDFKLLSFIERWYCYKEG